MAGAKNNPNFMNGVPELLVLRLLQEKSMYGYEIAQLIQVSTDAALTMGEGVLYPVLHSLERNGCLASRRVSVSGRTRIYYRLTPKGQRRLQKTISDWRRIADAISTVLGRTAHG